ncbi:DUF2062 domain-containing protein [Candidatus Woesearchaeota archaeon]|nr:DUF2062 domain-containing protein [Candidatus Woesearchaeota archaeon]
MGLRSKIKHHFHEVLRTKTSDHEIALGFAVGTFLEIFFILPGVGFILAILITLFYARLSKYALFFAVLFWNIIFIAPIYLLSYKVSIKLFPRQLSSDFTPSLYGKFSLLSTDFLVGHFIVSFIFSFFIYFVARWIVKVYRKRDDFSFSP